MPLFTNKNQHTGTQTCFRYLLNILYAAFKNVPRGTVGIVTRSRLMEPEDGPEI